MANEIDGTKAPHHGLFYMENAGGHNVEPEEASRSADERQSSCFAWEEEKGEDWRGGGGVKYINEKRPTL
jgi:hypothetical protein